jgi:hypothetical protein
MPVVERLTRWELYALVFNLACVNPHIFTGVTELAIQSFPSGAPTPMSIVFICLMADAFIRPVLPNKHGGPYNASQVADRLRWAAQFGKHMLHEFFAYSALYESKLQSIHAELPSSCSKFDIEIAS